MHVQRRTIRQLAVPHVNVAGSEVKWNAVDAMSEVSDRCPVQPSPIAARHTRSPCFCISLRWKPSAFQDALSALINTKRPKSREEARSKMT